MSLKQESPVNQLPFDLAETAQKLRDQLDTLRSHVTRTKLIKEFNVGVPEPLRAHWLTALQDAGLAYAMTVAAEQFRIPLNEEQAAFISESVSEGTFMPCLAMA